MDGFIFNVVLAGVAVLSFISGMLGLGAAFATIPYLSLFLPDLVHQVQPVALLLNGFTSLFAMVGFAKSGFIKWRGTAVLAAATTVSAPLGSFLAHHTPQMYNGLFTSPRCFTWPTGCLKAPPKPPRRA